VENTILKTMYTTKEYKNYKLIHNFISDEPLKAWINEGNFDDIYKEDWNALMEVVEKINELGYEVVISRISCQINKILDRDNLISAMVCGDVSRKREITYDAVVKFIIWYNQNK